MASIVSTSQMLLKAQAGGYAIGAFNVENMEMVQAVVGAAVELEAPVIIQTSVSTLKYAAAPLFRAMVSACIDAENIPIALHIDHGNSFEAIMRAIKGGYKSVMFDGSLLPYIDNVKQTAEIVKICHQLEVSVEAELGAIAGKKDAPQDSALLYTQPDTAADFVAQTQCDSLAVAIGTCHGIYKTTPKLDYERLQSIRNKVTVPLVLHGASGLSEEQVQKCIQGGICKVNIATELRQAWTHTVLRYQTENAAAFDPKSAGKAARQAVQDIVKQKIQMLGSAHKAYV